MDMFVSVYASVFPTWSYKLFCHLFTIFQQTFHSLVRAHSEDLKTIYVANV